MENKLVHLLEKVVTEYSMEDQIQEIMLTLITIFSNNHTFTVKYKYENRNFQIELVDMNGKGRIFSLHKFLGNKKIKLGFGLPDEFEGKSEKILAVLIGYLTEEDAKKNQRLNVKIYRGKDIAQPYSKIYRSCMSGNPAIMLYVTNPDKVAVVTFEDKDHGYLSRALLWTATKSGSGKEIMVVDRIYPNDTLILSDIKQYCKNQGWIHRTNQSLDGNNMNNVYGAELTESANLYVEMDFHSPSFPYADTFHYGFYDPGNQKLVVFNRDPKNVPTFRLLSPKNNISDYKNSFLKKAREESLKAMKETYFLKKKSSDDPNRYKYNPITREMENI